MKAILKELKSVTTKEQTSVRKRYMGNKALECLFLWQLLKPLLRKIRLGAMLLAKETAIKNGNVGEKDTVFLILKQRRMHAIQKGTWALLTPQTGPSLPDTALEWWQLDALVVSKQGPLCQCTLLKWFNENHILKKYYYQELYLFLFFNSW